MLTADQGVPSPIASMEDIKKVLPPFWQGSTIFAKKPNKLYSKAMVQDMMREAVEYVDEHWLQNEFELWLNEEWLNGNGWANEEKFPQFMGDLINRFIN